MLTLEEAKNLKPGDILLTSDNKRWKVSGQVHTWKRDPSRVRVPIKHGLYSYDYVTENNLELLTKEA
jgi:hypothetical protein